MAGSHYIVGIDLGTTNSVVAYVDTAADGSAPLQVLDIPQLTAPGTVDTRPLLPSFLYLAAPGEFAAGALALPWAKDSDLLAGELARKRGAEVPSRLVTSAKSWLSHAGVDRTAPILPWGGPEDARRMSPVEVSAQYLAHVRHAWKARMGIPLEEQEVLLTVPASFDAVARDLTLRAAHDAGLPNVTPIEEPQAAFYAWIDANGEAWRQAVAVGDVVLVCDIGGGTTDFSLIAVRDENGSLALERIAVGDHILLGGDNMDLALAYRVRERLAHEGTQLDPWQFRALTLSCRDAKERLLSGGKETKYPVALLGRGRKVVGGTLRTDVLREDVERALIDGFLPQCALTDPPMAQRRSALQEIGLRFASDPAITRHLAHFLRRQIEAFDGGGEGISARPTALLFNGGVMRADHLRRRIVDVVNGWFPGHHTGAPSVRVLGGADPEHAVARGAAYYGLARRGRGVRIRGGTPRSYYIGIETAMPAVPGVRPPIKALCVVPHGLEEGSEVDLPTQEFGLVVGEPTEFRFLSSSVRHDDVVGTIVETWESDIDELAPLETTLEARGDEETTVPVRLQARVNELGMLELWCLSRDGKQRWKLEFNVREARG